METLDDGSHEKIHLQVQEIRVCTCSQGLDCSPTLCCRCVLVIYEGSASDVSAIELQSIDPPPGSIGSILLVAYIVFGQHRPRAGDGCHGGPSLARGGGDAFLPGRAVSHTFHAWHRGRGISELCAKIFAWKCPVPSHRTVHADNIQADHDNPITLMA